MCVLVNRGYGKDINLKDKLSNNVWKVFFAECQWRSVLGAPLPVIRYRHAMALGFSCVNVLGVKILDLQHCWQVLKNNLGWWPVGGQFFSNSTYSKWFSAWKLTIAKIPLSLVGYYCTTFNIYTWWHVDFCQFALYEVTFSLIFWSN